MTKKEIKTDVEGYEIITNALLDLINSYPELVKENIQVDFSTLKEDSGFSMFPQPSAVVIEEIENICGDVEQTCQYPFHLVFRVNTKAETRKIKTKDLLDNLGKWLEKQPVTENQHKLTDYPILTHGRKITKINRITTAGLDSVSEKGVEDWVIGISLNYINNFER